MQVIDVPLTPDVEPSPRNENLVLLFVHGTLHGAWCYKYFQQFFADQGFITKAISLRGCGDSEIDQTASTTVSQHIDDLNEAVPKIIGTASPIIVAHSMGGFLIQKWMEQNTKVSVAGLVFMASTPPTGNSQIVNRLLGKLGLWKWLKLSLGFIRQTAAKDLSFCREVFFSKKDSEGFSEELEGDHMLREYMEQFKKTKLTLNTRSINNPVQSTGVYNGKVMVLCATDDLIVDEVANQETAEFWSGDLKMVQNAPHDLMLYSNWEKPARLILEWIREIDLARSTS
ncbi:alpha/beta hydrolase [Gracilaria domingensis]|nr:alpha/beta hydrolase [Gracilaria domingensis]